MPLNNPAISLNKNFLFFYFIKKSAVIAIKLLKIYTLNITLKSFI